MDRRTFIASTGAASMLALLAGLPGRALAQGQPAAAAPANGADAALNALMDRMFAGFMESSPEFATALGLDTGARAALKSRLSDYSAAEQARQLGVFRGYQRELQGMNRSAFSERGRLHYDTVRYLVDTNVSASADFPYGANGFGFSPYVISQQDGAYQNVPDFLDQQHRVSNAAEADAYLARLEAFGRALDQNSEKQREDAARGVFAPSFALDTTLTQLRALRGVPAAQTILVTSIARKAQAANLPGSYATRAEQIVTRTVFPALDRQIALVEQLRRMARIIMRRPSATRLPPQ